MFRVFINELPKEVREELRKAGEAMGDTDPIRLVADDVIRLAHSLRGLQLLLKVCAAWAAKNGLNCNPNKSQVLRVKPAQPVQEEEVQLYGVHLTFEDIVEYLGLLLTKDVFKGKYIE